MVAQNILRICEEIQTLFENNFELVTIVNLKKYIEFTSQLRTTYWYTKYHGKHRKHIFYWGWFRAIL